MKGNRTKRKEKLICSIDSIHLSIKGDVETHKKGSIFKYFTPGNGCILPIFKSVRRCKPQEKRNQRDSHIIEFKNGLKVKTSSTAGKGKQLHDKTISNNKSGIKEFALDSGGVVFQIGGISSYKHRYLGDYWRLLDFFEVLRQNWDFNMRFSEIHFSFDILHPMDSIKISPIDPQNITRKFMNTTYFHFENSKLGSRIDVKIYNKSLKDMVYLDVSRIELVCKSPFFKKLKSPRLLMAANTSELQESANLIAKELVTFFKNRVSVTLPSGKILIPDEKEIVRQVVLLTGLIQGKQLSLQNQYNPLQIPCREQEHLLEASYRVDQYISNLKKITGESLGSMLLNLSLPSTRSGRSLLNGEEISLATIHKIRAFLKINKTKILADNIRRQTLKIEQKLTKETVGSHIKNNRSDINKEDIAFMTYIKQEGEKPNIARIYHDHFTSSISTLTKDEKCEIATILFNKKVSNVDLNFINTEVQTILFKNSQVISKRIATILSARSRKKYNKATPNPKPIASLV